MVVLLTFKIPSWLLIFKRLPTLFLRIKRMPCYIDTLMDTSILVIRLSKPFLFQEYNTWSTCSDLEPHFANASGNRFKLVRDKWEDAKWIIFYSMFSLRFI
nr:hypothetical protein [Tanacetum cinerariifolium]